MPHHKEEPPPAATREKPALCSTEDPHLEKKKKESRFWLQKELMPKQACVLWIRAVGSFILAPFLRMLCDITHTGLLFPLCSNTLAQFQRASSDNRPSLQPTHGPCHLTSGNVLLCEKASARLLSWVALPHPHPSAGPPLAFSLAGPH